VEKGQMLARIVAFSLENAEKSQDSIESLVATFLSGKAKFIDYLDTVEPFSPAELTSFAHESNLRGIQIIHNDGTTIEGPLHWANGLDSQDTPEMLRYIADRHLYLLVTPRTLATGRIMIGFDAAVTDKLMAHIGLKQTIAKIVARPMVEYLYVQEAAAALPDDDTQAVLLDYHGKKLVEVRTRFTGDNILVIGVDASRYQQKITALGRQYLIVSIVLVALGVFFSWLLSTYQAVHLRRIVQLEREIAKSNEEASLGRAAAVISHEINNPLNAIGMGLQRLLLELELPPEYKDMIASMRQSVQRTSAIIANLKQYSRSFAPNYEPISPDAIIAETLVLYQPEIEEGGIKIVYNQMAGEKIAADKYLFAQVVENLLKNAIEAQQITDTTCHDAYIKIKSRIDNNDYLLVLENPNQQLDSLTDDIFKPYFTSKLNGVGLGLYVCKQIVEAHHGTITAELDNGVIRIMVKMKVADV
jgi:signal transduction histidine kinase